MRNPWKLTSFALAGALALSNVASVGADPQPKMHDALDHLQIAQRALEQATADKGGHRAKAIELTAAAIAQVKEGIKFDNRH